MQKVQMGGGAISPAVAAHVQKSAMQPAQANGSSKVSSTTQVGGGIISPTVKKHVASVTMGGGFVHPNVSRHIQAQ